MGRIDMASSGLFNLAATIAAMLQSAKPTALTTQCSQNKNAAVQDVIGRMSEICHLSLANQVIVKFLLAVTTDTRCRVSAFSRKVWRVAE
jgi:hypothetical protein